MKQKITEKYIIHLMKEEWQRKIQLLSEDEKKQKDDDIKIHVDIDGDGTKENVISPGLKVVKKKHKSNDGKEINHKSDPSNGLTYDVVSIDDRSGTITLSRPEANGSGKKTFVITKKEFEDNYKRK